MARCTSAAHDALVAYHYRCTLNVTLLHMCAVKRNHIKIMMRQIKTDAHCLFDFYTFGAVVFESEVARNNIVLRENGIEKIELTSG